VRVEQLSLTSFRSYEALELRLGPGPQIVVGDNAAGKTNLVEAIVLLARGSSHRTSSDAELVRWGDTVARVEAAIDHGGARGTDHLDVALERSGPLGAGARKRLRVDGVPRRASGLAEALRVVLFAPEEMLLVVGPPSLRRGAIDAMASAGSPAYGRALSTYGRALQQRNSLLRRIREGEADRDQLPYWDGIVTAEGGAIVAGRLELLERLRPLVADAHRQIAPSEPVLELRYLTNAPALAAESPAEAIARRLAETAEREVWNGATLVGPHRDDVTFELDGRDMTTFASRGQQRTAILSLKLAELDLLADPTTDERPLLLLDDVFSELDPDRRAHLVRRILDLPQAIVTTTALDDLDPALVAASSTWHVRENAVRPGAARVGA
jgi:DNA replication and repair protein RecF